MPVLNDSVNIKNISGRNYGSSWIFFDMCFNKMDYLFYVVDWKRRISFCIMNSHHTLQRKLGVLVLQVEENLGMGPWQREVCDLLCPATSHSPLGLHLKCWSPMVGQCIESMNHCSLNSVSYLYIQNCNCTYCFVWVWNLVSYCTGW